jgi:hypothetical protein
MMKEAVILLEKMLRRKIGNGNYTIRVNVANAGNLPNRAPFLRKVYRQTSLLEFMDSGLGEIKPLDHPLDIHYTVALRHLQEDKISDTYDTLESDLEDFMFSLR